MKNHLKIFQFLTLGKELRVVQNICVFCSIRWIGLVEIMKELNIWHYLVLKNLRFSIGLHNLSLNSGISDVISRNYAKIKADSDDGLAFEKIYSFHNFVILIKSVTNKNHNQYYYNVFLEKYLYQLAKK